jgi:hypothetical protein
VAGKRHRMLATLVAAGALVGALPAGPAVAAPVKARTPAVSLTILDRDRTKLAKANRLRVRVKTRGPLLVRVGAVGRQRSVSGRQVLRFRRAGTRTVSLRLKPAVRKRLRGCARETLRIGARARTGRGLRTYGTSRVMARTCSRTGLKPIETSDAGGPLTGPAIDVDTGLLGRACDFLDPSVCQMPFPNDWFTTRDTSTASTCPASRQRRRTRRPIPSPRRTWPATPRRTHRSW